MCYACSTWPLPGEDLLLVCTPARRCSSQRTPWMPHLTLWNKALTKRATLPSRLWYIRPPHLCVTVQNIACFIGEVCMYVLQCICIRMHAIHNTLCCEALGDWCFASRVVQVFVLSTVLERRYSQHRGVLDQYMEKSFIRPQVYQ